MLSVNKPSTLIIHDDVFTTITINVRILTLPYEHIPGELNKLFGYSVTKLYSKNGCLQHIDVFVHIYVARLLLLINDTRKQHKTRPP